MSEIDEKTEKKRKVGRPTKYHEGYPELILEYFSPERHQVYQEEVASQGKAVTITKLRPCDLPTIEGFCGDNLIVKDTLHQWVKKYPIFSDAYKIAKLKQKHLLNTLALHGEYNSGYAKFMAINCTDMVDAKSIDNTHNITEPVSVKYVRDAD